MTDEQAGELGTGIANIINDIAEQGKRTMSTPRHFLTLMDLSADELRALIHRAIALKAQRKAGDDQHSLAGKILAMIFTKASTRTRVSFEAGMTQLGGKRPISLWRRHSTRSRRTDRRQRPRHFLHGGSRHDPHLRAS